MGSAVFVWLTAECPIVTMGCPFSLLPLRMQESGLHLIHGPTQVHIPNGISTGSAVFAELTIVTDRQTDSESDHATPHLRSMRCSFIITSGQTNLT